MSAEYNRLVMYFVLILGLVIIGVNIIYFVELQHTKQEIQEARTDIKNATNEINRTQITVNQTRLFLHQNDYEDKAREIQTKIEQVDRSNQTRVLINNTADLLLNHHNGLLRINEDLRKFIEEQNHGTRYAIDQNQDIVDILTNITRNLEKTIKNTEFQITKYSPENNALVREISKKLGINTTDILEK